LGQQLRLGISTGVPNKIVYAYKNLLNYLSSDITQYRTKEIISQTVLLVLYAIYFKKFFDLKVAL